MPRSSQRTEYCQKQAAECAAAASAAAMLDVKEAYLNLEQGWLQLAPEIDQPRPYSLVRESSNNEHEICRNATERLSRLVSSEEDCASK
jgi:hypothetical protein